MTRDEANELMARAINKAAGLPDSDIDCGTEHANEALDALIAAGWTGPGEKETVVYGAGVGPMGNGQPTTPAQFKMPRQLPMPEYKFQKEEPGSMQTNAIKDGRDEWQDKENARIEKIDLGDPRAIRYSLDDLNAARSLARTAALEDAANVAESYGDPEIAAAIRALKGMSG